MKQRHVAVVAKKELAGIYREKTIVFAILLQLFIALFSSFLMVGLTTMYDPDALAGVRGFQYGVGYVGLEEGDLYSIIDDRRDLAVYQMDLNTAIAALKERQLSAVLWVSASPPDGEGPVLLTLYTLQNDMQAAIVEVKMKEVFLEYEAMLREIRSDRLTMEPIRLTFPEGAGTSNYFEFVFGLLIPLLIFMPAIISAALVIDLICEEYQSGTLETLLSTTVTYTEMLWGKIMTCILIVPIQSAAWLALLAANGIVVDAPFAMLLHVIAGSFVLILIGAFCALHYRERTSAQFIFSTAVVVVIITAMSVPYNPLNILVRLGVGTMGSIHWLVLAGMIALGALLVLFLNRYADQISRLPLTTR
ncbi:MAG: ABC transporter permease [Methanocalculus sp. MSAO_Arc1]|uniref:ABC transporter permease n=1 Tax=Methanocalculus TaxID=71151 RepID=UPI000FF70AD1|nr:MULTISPECIES: ABC transporter permease [unclassified Methanocalculus]MCP1662193.1 ABC-type Na+ efflux pump permease subunit [Methanocalculus sp. AMF5]RQD79080.1 MAG: ABC transporter permease [Methanocalculus sp. MSAO_Arc1]